VGPRASVLLFSMSEKSLCNCLIYVIVNILTVTISVEVAPTGMGVHYSSHVLHTRCMYVTC
jgi:hypothetical protein